MKHTALMSHLSDHAIATAVEQATTSPADAGEVRRPLLEALAAIRRLRRPVASVAVNPFPGAAPSTARAIVQTVELELRSRGASRAVTTALVDALRPRAAAGQGGMLVAARQAPGAKAAPEVIAIGADHALPLLADRPGSLRVRVGRADLSPLRLLLGRLPTWGLLEVSQDSLRVAAGVLDVAEELMIAHASPPELAGDAPLHDDPATFFAANATAVHDALQRAGAECVVLFGAPSTLSSFKEIVDLGDVPVAAELGSRPADGPRPLALWRQSESVRRQWQGTADAYLMDLARQERAVHGIDKVIAALTEHRVDRLLVTWTLDQRVWLRPEVVQRAGPLLAGVGAHAVQWADLLPRLVDATGAVMVPLRGAAEVDLRRSMGGCAALLRW